MYSEIAIYFNVDIVYIKYWIHWYNIHKYWRIFEYLLNWNVCLLLIFECLWYKWNGLVELLSFSLKFTCLQEKLYLHWKLLNI